MKKNKKIVFNHFYRLKHDLKRTYILSPDRNNSSMIVSPHVTCKIHPVYAMIFSFFSKPILLNKAVEEVSYFIDIPEIAVREFICGLIGNKEIKHCKSKDGTTSSFPLNILIEERDAFVKEIIYSPSQFAYEELDFKHKRLFTSPIGIALIVNNSCVTDCCYCYADKKTKTNLMPFSRVKTIIKNAYKANICNFYISGGEVFLYKQWKELLFCLHEFGFPPPLLSTKIPVKEADIMIIKELGSQIQISLDSLSSRDLYKMLHVNSEYADKMKQTIMLLNQKNISFQVTSVITKYNDSIENLEEIYEFLSQFEHLFNWEVRIAFRSLYSRNDFIRIRISKESEQKIYQWIQSKKRSSEINIQLSQLDKNKYFGCESGSTNFTGGECSGNHYNMIVMPDGKVTICEQLYWNPRFIIGDLSTQSIEEVWNSPRALWLSNLQKKDFQDSSVCKQCDIFEDCYDYHNKCYVDVLKAYGDKNWDFPDPRCKFAPPFIYDLLNS